MTKEQLDKLRDAAERYTDKSAIPNARGKLQLLISHIDAQQSEIEMLRESLEEWRLDFSGLKKDNARLRKAIKTHQLEVWGKVKVSHPDDADLYAALEETTDDNT